MVKLGHFEVPLTEDKKWTKWKFQQKDGKPRNYQTEITEQKTTIIKLQDSVGWFNIRLDKAEKKNLWTQRQGSRIHSIRRARRKKIEEKSEDSVKDLWNTIKQTNICIIVVLDREDKERK